MGSRGHTNGGVVLLRSVDTVGKLVVGGHMIELCRELVVDGGNQESPPLKVTQAPPSLPSIMRWGLSGVDPQVMVVAVWCGHLGKRLTRIDGFIASVVQNPHRVSVLGVGEQVLIIPGPPL